MKGLASHKKQEELFNLNRFLIAQENIYIQVIKELKLGQKQSHWMWYIFPQIVGLGESMNTLNYSIKSVAEAKAYLQHKVLGVRLIECTHIVNTTLGKSVYQIFGHPDEIKFHSSMTLFGFISPHESVFNRAINKFFNGEKDNSTLSILEKLKA